MRAVSSLNRLLAILVAAVSANIRATVAEARNAARCRRGAIYGASFLALATMGWLGSDQGLLWSATASIWTCLADPGGTARDRLPPLAAVGLGGAFASALGGAMAGSPIVAVAVVLFAGLAAGMVELRGTAAALSAKLLYVVLIAACLQPVADANAEVGNAAAWALQMGRDYLLGGAFACAVSLALLPSARDTRPRPQMVAIFTALQVLARTLAESALPPGGRAANAPEDGQTDLGKRRVRERIEQARELLAAQRSWFDAATLLHYRYLIAMAEAVFALLIVASDLRGRRGHELLPLRHLHRCLDDLREQIEQGLSRHAADLPALTRSMYLQLRRVHGQVANASAPPLYHAALASLARFPDFAAWRASFHWPRRSLWIGLREWSTALAELGAGDARVTRHAVRLALAGGLSLLPGLVWRLDHGYWVAVTVIMVLSPQLQTTRRISLQRFAGSLGGALLACLVGLLHPAAPVALAISAVSLSAAYVARLAGSPGLFALMLTPAVILFSWIGEPASDSSHVAMLRGADTAFGCLIALASYLVLAPRAELSRARRRARDAVAIHAIYLRAAFAQAMSDGALDDSELRLEALRVAAGRASARAEQALEQAGTELDRAIVAELARLHVTVRRMAALAGVIRAETVGSEAPVPASADTRRRLAEVQDELATLAARPGEGATADVAVKGAVKGDATPVDGTEEAATQVAATQWRDRFLLEQALLARRHAAQAHAGVAAIATLAPARGGRWRRLPAAG
ncbi:FUSC family protein [Cupriavidus gilardii]|uniref:FUSC family protein n=1 Tax=Cupriavidus gilardii TaxID=82541 RepID=UPI0021D7F5DB